MILELHRMLHKVRSRVRIVRQRWILALCWLFWAAIAGLFWANAELLEFTGQQIALVIVIGALVTAVISRILLLRSTRDPHRIAQLIEARHPELGAALLAALEQAPSPRVHKLGYLQSSVLREAVKHGREHNWNRNVPFAQLLFAQIAQLATLALLAAICVALFNRGDAVARSVNPTSDLTALIQRPVVDVSIQPGDTEIERGTTLLVVAEFGKQVPSEATLLLQPVEQAKTGDDASDSEVTSMVSSRPMTLSFEDPKFVGRVASVDSDLLYSVEFAGTQSKQYRVTVFDYPLLERANAELTYPDYTSLETKVIDDVRSVTAVEGTKLTFRCQLNKEVTSAKFVDRNGEELPLVRTESEAPEFAVTLTLAESRSFKLFLTDDQGRQNKLPPEFVVSVTPNRPAKLKIENPTRDVRVSPIEELNVSGVASDDFGLLRLGISYSVGGTQPHDLVLFDHTGDEVAIKKAEIAHLIDFESLEAEPDQLLSYYFWAEDIGPNGLVRQTMSDMYFAEVRHFEEIFRQGEQPTEQQQRESQEQQQGQATAQQAQELAELQKQIVNATWALIRRETDSEPSSNFAEDVRVITESQQQALSQLDELTGQLNDQDSISHAAAAQTQMQNVLTQLSEIKSSTGISGLRPAFSAEQAAYQALLKLRAREFSVVQGNAQQQGSPSGSASGQTSRSQQQLNELELSAEQNRYETQSRAQDQREQAQTDGSANQVLDRLRELARRQEDLNERVRQLQSELEAAQNDEERENIERELKRLREQQQEILRDTDQLQSDMSTAESSSQTEEAQRQLQETRDRIQQASEALEQGRMSDAISEGARAGRELGELRDEFRRRTADDFSEEMRELSDAARQLDERQRELAENLSQQGEQQNRSLRDDGSRQEILEGLAEQRREYEELVQQIQQTVSEAEEPEPLLARQLYETIREANKAQVAEAINITEQLLDVGVLNDANETMRVAANGIGQLREGVDSAAESVLGDDTEALRRAERELEDLEAQLNREIREAQSKDDPAQQPEGRESRERQREPQGQSGTQQENSRTADNEQIDEQQSPSDGGQPSNSQQRERQADGNNQSPQSGRPSDQQTQQDSQQPDGRESSENGQPQDQRSQDGSSTPPGGRQQGTNPSDRQSGRGGLPQDLADLLDEWQTDPGGPITGEDFREWNDRMRDVQDLLNDPDLRAEVARIRDRAEAARADYRRDSKTPDWNKLIEGVANPLAELRARVREERQRRESPESLVPIDRDPVPVEYADTVQEYYQRLGSGE